jgi:DNA-binding transcriptional ArsR family regulator
MKEIIIGSLEEQIIIQLQKTDPITVSQIQKNLHVSQTVLLRTLKKLQVSGIVRLDPLPGTIYVRLLRNDFSFIGRKQQQKVIKRSSRKKQEKSKDYDGIMYS